MARSIWAHLFRCGCGFFMITGLSFPAFADGYPTSHAVINTMRSNTMFISQGVEGEYGVYTKIPAGESQGGGVREMWRGFGLRNTIGFEMFKFVQFSLSHTLLNMRSKGSSFESQTGSRVSGDARLVFSSPIGNVEVGSGVIASYYEYQHDMERADYIGSGYYYSLGLNYFLSSKVSIFTGCKLFQENMVRNDGSASIESIHTNTTAVGLGFSVWI